MFGIYYPAQFPFFKQKLFLSMVSPGELIKLDLIFSQKIYPWQIFFLRSMVVKLFAFVSCCALLHSIKAPMKSAPSEIFTPFVPPRNSKFNVDRVKAEFSHSRKNNGAL